jgi:DNA polymerase-3 subunit epsilon
MNRFAVVDLETTGFGKYDRVVEIGIVLVDGQEITQEWETLINPQRDISNSLIHGITADLVSVAPTFEEIVDEISNFLHDRIFVAHNIAFDGRMLEAEFSRLKRQLDLGLGFCTLQATREKLSQACSSRGIRNETAHRALTDARATALLFSKIFREQTLAPVQIPNFTANKSPRILSRAALQGDHAPGHTSLRRIVRNVPIDGWDGPLLSYMDGLCSVLSDLRLTADERRHLKDWATELDLSEDQETLAHEAFVNSVIAAANRDSFISDSERDLIERISLELGVTATIPQQASAKVQLTPGMTICFTGQARDFNGNDINREDLHTQATEAGFVPVDSVTKSSCDLLVAANKASMSGKAKKARDFGKPVISVEEFLGLIKSA